MLHTILFNLVSRFCLEWLVQGTQIFSVFLLWKIHPILTVSCPPQMSGDEWSLRAWEVCPSDGSLYHCLSTQGGDYIEICLAKINVTAGHFPKYSKAGREIYLVTCPFHLYQPTWQWSNLIYKCDREKTVCESEFSPGQLECDDGSSTMDRSCYCDYRNGYVASIYALKNPQKKRCYVPSQVSSRCVHISPCEMGWELNSAYECVPVCGPGMHRPEHELNCEPKPSEISAETATTTMSSTVTSSRLNIDPPERNWDPAQRLAAERKRAFEEQEQSSSLYKTVLIALTLVSIFVIVAVFICVPKGYYFRRLRNCICKVCCGKEESEEVYPIPLLVTPHTTPHPTPAPSPYHTPCGTPRVQRLRSTTGDGRRDFLAVPERELVRSSSLIDREFSPSSFLDQQGRRLSKSETQLTVPDNVAKMLLIKHRSPQKGTEAKLGGRSKDKKQSPLAKSMDQIKQDFSDLSLNGASTSASSSMNDLHRPIIIKKQTVYYINNVQNSIIGKNARMIIKQYSESETHPDEDESEDENISDGENENQYHVESTGLIREASRSELDETQNERDHAMAATRKPNIPTESECKEVIDLAAIDTALQTLQQLTSEEYHVQDVQHDGDCLYHCVIQLTGWNSTPSKLREWVAKYMRDNSEMYKNYLSKDGECPDDELDEVWDRYLDGVLAREWGDYFVLVALANIFQIQINVVSTRTPNNIIPITPTDASVTPRYTIHIGHLTDVSSDRDLHFVILKKKK